MRKFLIRALLLGLSGCSDDLSEANKFLREFPNEVPGAEVEKFEVEDAQHTLVHVRTAHYVDIDDVEAFTNLTADDLQPFYDYINRVQRDVFETYNFLIGNGLMEDLYAEFVTPTYSAGDLLGERRKGIEFAELEDMEYIEGAELKMFESGMLTILPGQPRLNDLLEERENYILERLVKSGRVFGYTNLGAKHFFGRPSLEEYTGVLPERISYRNNILELMGRRDGERVSLIEITPISLGNSDGLRKLYIYED